MALSARCPITWGSLRANLVLSLLHAAADAFPVAGLMLLATLRPT